MNERIHFFKERERVCLRKKKQERERERVYFLMTERERINFFSERSERRTLLLVNIKLFAFGSRYHPRFIDYIIGTTAKMCLSFVNVNIS